MMQWVIPAAIIALLLFYNFLEDIYMIYINRFPPGPLSLPIIGGLHRLQIKQPHISLSNLAQKYKGILSLRMGPAGRVVFIQNIDMILKMLKMKSAANRPNLPYFEFISPNADGIGSCPYSPSWKLQTKLFHNAMSKISETTLEDHVNESLNALFKRFDERNGCPFDPSVDLRKFTLHVLCKTIYGHNYEDLDDPEIQEILDRDHFLLLGLASIHPLNLFPWLKYLPIPLVKKIERQVQKRDLILVEQYNRHFENYDGRIRDILDVIIHTLNDRDRTIQLSNKQKQHLNKDNMIMSVWAMFTAGTSTFYEALNWSLLYLAKHPTVAMECFQEIDRGNTNTFLAHKKRFPYTEAVTLEVLRLGSTVGMGIPHVGTEDITIGGYVIPKGTEMFYHSWFVHHSESNWTDPEQFSPERFLDSNGQVVDTNTLKNMPFIPFGAGVRTCIGQRLAMNIFFQFISTILYRYELELADKQQDLDMKGQIETLVISPPHYHLILKPRTHIQSTSEFHGTPTKTSSEFHRTPTKITSEFHRTPIKTTSQFQRTTKTT